MNEIDKTKRPRDLVWEALVEVCDGAYPVTKSERGRYNRACKELKEIEASPAEIRARAARWRSLWPGVTLTPTGLTANWSVFAPPSRPVLQKPVSGEGDAVQPTCMHGVVGICRVCRAANLEKLRSMMEGIGSHEEEEGDAGTA